MKFWIKVLEVLNTKMVRPTPYGWFHLLWWAIMITALVLLWRYARHASHKHVRMFVFWMSIVLWICEVYKQINFTFEYSTGVIIADYKWYIFPFQFCSTPMYAGVLLGILRKGKVHDALAAYLATYGVFAGGCVMAYPDGVLINTVGINIQTMIWHSSMVVMGLYLLMSGYVKAEHRTVLRALPVFFIAVGMAVIMNEIAYYSGLLQTETFNMFYISRHLETTLKVYDTVQHYVPYPLCLIIYMVGFSLAAYLVLLLAICIKNLSVKRKSHSQRL